VLRAGRVTLQVDQSAVNRLASDQAVLLAADVVRQILNRATVLCPVRYGNLRGHHKVRLARVPPGARGEVYNDAEYAEVVHEGSGPYIIRPKRKKALRFVVDGRTVFAKQVRHPGTRGRPWLARAGEEVARREGWRWDPGR
jgi:hypothetical protein